MRYARSTLVKREKKISVKTVHCDFNLLQSRTTRPMLGPVSDYWVRDVALNPTCNIGG